MKLKLLLAIPLIIALCLNASSLDNKILLKRIESLEFQLEQIKTKTNENILDIRDNSEILENVETKKEGNEKVFFAQDNLL